MRRVYASARITTRRRKRLERLHRARFFRLLPRPKKTTPRARPPLKRTRPSPRHLLAGLEAPFSGELPQSAEYKRGGWVLLRWCCFLLLFAFFDEQRERERERESEQLLFRRSLTRDWKKKASLLRPCPLFGQSTGSERKSRLRIRFLHLCRMARKKKYSLEGNGAGEGARFFFSSMAKRRSERFLSRRGDAGKTVKDVTPPTRPPLPLLPPPPPIEVNTSIDDDELTSRLLLCERGNKKAPP